MWKLFLGIGLGLLIGLGLWCWWAFETPFTIVGAL